MRNNAISEAPFPSLAAQPTQWMRVSRSPMDVMTEIHFDERPGTISSRKGRNVFSINAMVVVNSLGVITHKHSISSKLFDKIGAE